MNEVTENGPDVNGTTEQTNKSDISTLYRLRRAFIILMLLTFVGFALKVFINLTWPPS